MTRLILRLLVVALFVAGALFFADHPGHLSLSWNGWRVETSVALLVGGIVIVILLGWAIMTGLSRLIGSPRRLAARRREARRLMGYRAMTDGLVAIAAGDSDAAEKLSRRADKFFKQSRHPAPPLTRLITAQLALLRHDHASAKIAFAALADHDETEFLGLRGLIVQALKTGDETTALRLIERADRLRPGTGWVMQTRISLEARFGEWRRAHDTIDRAARSGAITKDRAARHRMTVWFVRSREAIKDGRLRDALTYAAQAHGLDPNFPPLVIHYAERLIDHGDRRKALRILSTGWTRSGDAGLLAAYDRLLSPETPAKRLVRLERVIATRAYDAAGHIAVASVAIAGRLWGEARRHLTVAGADGPGPWSAPLCRLNIDLARLDRQDNESIQLWRDRLTQAPPESTWICTECGGESSAWDALCPHCHAFDSLVWRLPGSRPRSVDTAAPTEEFPTLELISSPPSDAARRTASESPIDIEAIARDQGS